MDKNIKFGAEGSSVSSFMKRLQADSKQLFSEFSKESEKQTKDRREQVKLIEQQIAALKRANDLEKEQNRIILERKRDAGLSDKEYRKQSSQLRDDDRINSFQSKALNDLLSGLKEKTPDEKPKVEQSVFNGVLAAGIFRDLMGLIRQVPNAQTDVDLLSPFASMSGGAIGGGIGLMAGYNAAAGATIGKEVGGFVGDAVSRHLRERENSDASINRVRGRIGSLRGGNLAMFGMDRAEGAQFEEQLANASASSNSRTTIERLAALSQAYNLDKGVLGQFSGTVSRMGGSDIDASRVAAEAMARGVNQSELPDLFKNMSSMVGLMGQSSSGSPDIRALQSILEFNNIGGNFSLKDPRSMGLMSTIQGSITNPGSPMGQALGYSVLRGQNPNASYLDLMIKRQEGGSDYAGKLIERISGMVGGNEDLAVPILAKQFGLTGNLSAARDLFRGKGNLGSLTGQRIASADYSAISAQGQALTPELEKTKAAITNAFITGADEGIKEITTKFTQRMSAAIDRIAEDQLNKMKGYIGFGGSKEPNKNGK